MNSVIFQIFDNRQLAILLWFCLLCLFVLFSKSIRASISVVIKSLIDIKIATPLIIMTAYIVLIIYLLYKKNFWDFSFLFDTLIWFFSVAFLLFRESATYDSQRKYKDIIFDSFKIAAVIEFISNLYVFSFIFEFLFIVPFSVIIGVILGFSSAKKEYSKAVPFMQIVASIFGLFIIVFVVFNILINFTDFTSLYNLKEFLLPIFLTIALLPLIFLLSLFIAYETVFSHINQRIINKSDRRYAKFITVWLLNFKLNKLRKWSGDIFKLNSRDRESIKQSINEINKN